MDNNQEKLRKKKRREISIADMVEGVKKGDRSILARAITLVESNANSHVEKAQEVINQLLPFTGNSVRIGITGVPGAGKSTFIEAFGTHLCNKGHKVAVIAVDPSSTVSRGSILGDKTRMDTLSRNERAYVRPSPSGGTLGGVNRKTRETILLCEAAGYDVILIETIGVGQSEVVVRSMVDFFLLLVLTGAGDELQGMKKGVMELVDTIVVHKADGDNKTKARIAQEEYNQMLHYINSNTPGWRVQAFTASSLYGEGIEHIYQVVNSFVTHTKTTGFFEQRRQLQLKEWMYSMIKDQLQVMFFSHTGVKKELPLIEEEIFDGKKLATCAVRDLFTIFEGEDK
ncbi:methylmalonyl Co-A mutase-associated GTPase MeaB [Litchfieldia alkalitelluris]|uniref:methylmalonyl Co-A mutase-associated GTPase MeaB n=1 Tax=Litchfieldia alkalitelluris TaxID=304268 RepID=UPI0009987825|nr:methylmalonyl Co-A mutase-associated GTPase MeaB [Litchfieldia alkalitelluris]